MTDDVSGIAQTDTSSDPSNASYRIVQSAAPQRSEIRIQQVVIIHVNLAVNNHVYHIERIIYFFKLGGIPKNVSGKRGHTNCFICINVVSCQRRGSTLGTRIADILNRQLKVKRLIDKYRVVGNHIAWHATIVFEQIEVKYHHVS